MKACRLAAEKSAMGASRTRRGPPSCTSTAPAISILPSALRPWAPAGGSALVRCGITVSSISTRPASGERWGATMAWRSLAHSSQADLYEPSPSCFCSCRAAIPLECVAIRYAAQNQTVSGSFRAVHHRARSDRGLLAAAGAFPGEGLGRKLPALVVVTVRAAEPIGPARVSQICRTRALIREAVLKLDERVRKVDHGEPSRQGVRYMFYPDQPAPSPHVGAAASG